MHIKGVNNLAAIRALKGLNQAQLAELIGKNQSTIQRAEAEHHSAKLETYKKCAEVLGVRLSDIFDENMESARSDIIRVVQSVSDDDLDRVRSILDLVLAEGKTAAPAPE